MTNNINPMHYANALAFIIDSLTDESPVSEFGSGHLREISIDDALEWADRYNFTLPALNHAIDQFQRASLVERQSLEGR